MNLRILRGKVFNTPAESIVFRKAYAAFQLHVGSGKLPSSKQSKSQSFMRKHLVNRIVCIRLHLANVRRGLEPLEGSRAGSSSPQPKHCGKGVFVKSAFLAQLKCSRVGFLHAVRTPAFDGPEGVAERRLKQQSDLSPSIGLSMRGISFNPCSK